MKSYSSLVPSPSICSSSSASSVSVALKFCRKSWKAAVGLLVIAPSYRLSTRLACLLLIIDNVLVRQERHLCASLALPMTSLELPKSCTGYIGALLGGLRAVKKCVCEREDEDEDGGQMKSRATRERVATSIFTFYSQHLSSRLYIQSHGKILQPLFPPLSSFSLHKQTQKTTQHFKSNFDLRARRVRTVRGSMTTKSVYVSGDRSRRGSWVPSASILYGVGGNDQLYSPKTAVGYEKHLYVVPATNLRGQSQSQDFSRPGRRKTIGLGAANYLANMRLER